LSAYLFSFVLINFWEGIGFIGSQIYFQIWDQRV
jgi:hypothetical protein